MKTILIPTDFSKEASFALPVAAAIAKKMNVQLYMMHIIQSLYEEAYASTSDLPEEGQLRLKERIDKAEKHLEAVILEQGLAGQSILPYVKVDTIFEDIPQIIARSKGDLIVMGTKGDQGFHEVLIGSNVEKVVRYAHCPVLAVPRAIDHFNLNTVVLATTFDDQVKPLVNLLSEWQAVFGFQLHLIYVNTPLIYTTTAKIEARINRFLEKNPVTHYTTAIIDDYSELDGIRQYAQKVNPDMIALLTHGRDGFNHFLDGSVTEDAVNHLTIPVLTYNSHTIKK